MTRPDTEIELKMRVASDGARRFVERELDDAPRREVETVYFDTPDHKLRRAGYALRLRREDGGWTQSVKGGRGGIARYEREAPVTACAVDRGLLSGTPLADAVGRADALEPVFETRVVRRSRVLEADGARIELSLDEGEVVAGARRREILEVELELKEGSPAALFADARRLCEREALVLDLLSKAERGYGLAEDRVEVKHAPAPVGADPTALELFGVNVRAGLRQLSENAAQFLDLQRPETLHQARVGLRRLRVLLSLFRRVGRKAELQRLRAELRWLQGEIGDARDLDVFSDLLTTPERMTAVRAVEAEALRAAARLARRQAYQRARAAFGSRRYRSLLVDLTAMVEMTAVGAPPPGPQAQERARDFARRALDKRLKAFRRRRRRLDWDDGPAVHRLRIAAKHLRYACDACAPIVPKKAAGDFQAYVDKLKALQDDLGALNDLRVLESSARKALERSAGAAEPAFAAGVLSGEARLRRDRLVRHAKRRARRFAAREGWW